MTIRRLPEMWRIALSWRSDCAHEVTIVDYH
jgi:plasmid maintenance system killer protein